MKVQICVLLLAAGLLGACKQDAWNDQVHRNTQLQRQLDNTLRLNQQLQRYIDENFDKVVPARLNIKGAHYEYVIDSLRREIALLEKNDKVGGNISTDQSVGMLNTELDRYEARFKQALSQLKDGGIIMDRQGDQLSLSLSDELLFESGSTEISAPGLQSLRDISGLLRDNADIHLRVVGHTDDVPVTNLGAVKDNWDLSVLRATAVVRALVGSGLPADRIMAAGAGSHQPLKPDKAAGSRKQNRRTEIYLVPGN